MVEEVIEEIGTLQLSREGCIRLFEAYRAQGLSMIDAYYKVYDYCETKGYKQTYSSFESFKDAYYNFLRK